MAKSAYTLPDGYKDEAEFLKEARERYQQGCDFDRENRDAGVEDLKFFAGEQWDAAAEKARKEKGRPCLTINRLPQFVAQIVGDIRINRPAIKVRPAEDADKDLADIREGLIRAIERQSNAQGVYASAGQDQVVCGIGNFRINLEYAADDAFDQDIMFRRIADPFAVVWDPMILDPTGKDAKWLFVEDSMSKKDFERAYPDQQPSELEIRESGWTTADTVKITEYWLRKETKVELALLNDGKVVEVNDKNRAQLSAPGVMVKTRKGTKTSWCMYLTNGTSILEKPYELPISRPPIFRVPGWEVTIDGKKHRWGLVRFAKDPQRFKNYWRSVQAERLALEPRAPWLINTGPGGLDAESVDDFRGAATSGDSVLEWSGQFEPKRQDPPQFPSALAQEAVINDQDMKDVTGLHDASLGAKSNETSGKAILARQKEGDIASYIYHDNLQGAIREGGLVVNQLIPISHDTARTIRVVGEDEGTKLQRINDPNDPNSVDISKGKYDIVVETGPSYSTRRAEAAESMMQFVQAVPAAAQVAGDLIAIVQDWPMADKIGERLKKTLPPNMIDDDDEDLSDEERMAKQQAAQQAAQMGQMQQQMQMQSAQLEIEKQAAEVAKLEAEALKIGMPEPGAPQEHPLDLMLKEQQVRKAFADADKAEAEAAKARAEVPALVAKTEAEAAKAQIGVQSDVMDLQRKPLEAAHSEADLDLKLNPPKETEAA